MPVIAISASLASVWLTGLIRNTLSMPSNARRAVAGSRKLPWAAVTLFAAFSFEGSRVRTLTSVPLPTSSFTTAEPTVPVPPVTRMLITSSKRLRRFALQEDPTTAGPISPLHEEAPGDEQLADALAQIALQFHPLVGRGAARAARALEVLAQLLQERGVVRQAED